MGTGDLVIATDFGTSSVKIGVVGADLKIQERVTVEYPLHVGPNGVAEQNPEDWWRAFRSAMTQLSARIPDLAQRVGALSFCSQACGLICVGEDGAPLTPCLTWLDKRAANISRELAGGFPEVAGYNAFKLARWLRVANGAPSKNGMDAVPKLHWVMRNQPEIYARTRWAMDVKDWLLLRATGEATTTPESANLTWIMDTRKGREGWSPRLARLVGVDLSKMPRIVQADEVMGQLTARAADDLGLAQGTPVMGGTSDFTAAALGAGVVDDGELHICAATSAWIAGFLPNRRISVSDSYATLSTGLGFRPLLIASQENAGSALAWSVNLTGEQAEAEDPADTFDNLGPALPDDPMFLPWLAGEKVPQDNDKLRGVYHGLGLHHDASALRRATLEGVALNLRWAYERISREKGVTKDAPISLVGGVAGNPTFAQMLADALNRPTRVGEPRHVGVLGAAVLAAPTMGWHSDVWTAARHLKTLDHTTYDPRPDRVAELDRRNGTLRKIRRHILRTY